MSRLCRKPIVSLTAAALLAMGGADLGHSKSAHAQSPLSPAAPPETAPPLPDASSDASGAYVGDVLYVHAGEQRSPSDTSDRTAALHALSPTDASWTTVWTGDPVRGVVLASDGGDLYRVGGAEVTAPHRARPDLQRWDWAARRWVDLTPMPSGRTDHAAVVVGRRLWVFGGWAPSTEDWRDEVLFADLDVAPVVWTVVGTASLRLRSLAAAAHDDAIWIAGGMTPQGPELHVHRLDLETQTLALAPAPPIRGRSRGVGLGLASTGGALYASDANQLFRLDTGENTWQALAYDIAPERAYHALVGGPGTLHIVGGVAHGRTHAEVSRVETASLRPSDVVEAPRRSGDTALDRPPLTGATRWPGFRGTSFGHSQARDLPLTWSDEENIAWRHTIGGYGQSSPVVWDGTVFVTAIDGPQRETQIVEAVDVDTGRLRWRHTLASSQPVEVTNFVAKGAPTPLVDAERVYYLFESGDLGALSRDGDPIWSRSLHTDYGEIQGYGLGGSLAASDETLFVLVSHDGPSYLLAIDPATGETRWKAERPVQSAWTTPTVVPWSGGALVVVSIDGMVEAYDAASGERVWWIDGLSGNTLSSPVLAEGRIVISSGDSRSTLALPIEHRGLIPDEQVVWRGSNATASMSSPVATGEAVYFINSRGVLRSLELSSGRSRWAVRLASPAWATPIVNGDRIYVFGTDGVTSVVAADAPEPTELARNSLTVSERVYGVASVDGALLVRTGRELIRIGRGEGTGGP